VKRTFTLGTAADRKVVVIEVNGPHVCVTQKKADGTTRKSEKDLSSEAKARSECERMALELTSRGFVEQTAPGPAPSKARPAAAASKAADPALKPGKIRANDQYADVEPAAAEDGPVLARLAAGPGAGAAADGAPKKKKKAGGKKKKKKAASPDALDKRVLAGIGAVGAACVAVLGFFLYDAFLKPPTIVGTWAGSMIDYEIGKPIIHTQYRLVLDEKKRASLTLQEKFTSVGTYAVQGDRLKLTLKEQKDEKDKDDEDVVEIPAGEREYKISLGRATLDLYDPASGKKLVQLIRFLEEPQVKGQSAGPKPPAATDVADAAGGEVDKEADARLASVELVPKDNAFKVRYPRGWEPDTGSRPDNSYSWASFTQGSAKIQVFADVKGSLMAGSPNAQQHEEGSELAPVHNAHVLYEKTVAEEFSNYKESKPALFKGSPLGEGRLATFTASSGGLLGGTRLRGYRVTLLTNDRRITVLCQCPEGDLAKLKPTFLAVCRSLSR
jgi:hypothetical protein